MQSSELPADFIAQRYCPKCEKHMKFRPDEGSPHLYCEGCAYRWANGVAEWKQEEIRVRSEMERKANSDYRPLSGSQKINILHEVIIKLDAKIDHLEELVQSIYSFLVERQERL